MAVEPMQLKKCQYVGLTPFGTHFVGHDGNGNVALLTSASGGTASAYYEYDAFGGVLRATGPMALLNPFRFSTKYTDGESAFNYYGYRSYNPTAGRWLSRDPVCSKTASDLCATRVRRCHHQTIFPSSSPRRNNWRADSGAPRTNSRTRSRFSGDVAAVSKYQFKSGCLNGVSPL